MNILYVLNSANPGGMEYHVLDLVKGFVNKGDSVFVWCPNGQMSDLYKSAGASIFTNEIKLEIDPAYINRLSGFIKENAISLIHAHELKAVVNSSIVARFHKVPIITHTHTPISTWQIPGYKKSLDILIDNFFVNTYSSSEIALTESRKLIKISEGIIANKITVIPNAIDTSKFDMTEDQRIDYKSEIRSRYGINENIVVIGFLSRMSQEKGHFLLVQAFSEFLKNSKNPEKYVLLLAGGGVLEEQVKSLATKLHISDRVITTGIFTPEDQRKFYCVFDYFVFPSLAEGFGYVLIEAMYNNLPVLCSDLEVLKEVAGDTVMYFKTGNAQDLSDKIGKLLSQDENAIINKTTSAKKLVLEKYTQDMFIDSYAKLYERVMK